MSAGVAVIGADGDARRAARPARDRRRAERLVVVREGPYRTEDRVPIASAAGRRHARRRAARPARAARPWSGRCRTRRRPRPCGSAWTRSSGCSESCPRSQAVGGALRRRLPRRRRGARRAARRAEPRPRPDGRGRRDRARARAGAGARAAAATRTRSSRPPSSRASDERGRRVRVDVATARTEFYGAPGALPEVERSTLRHDLARRDFTINAMATSLKADDLGATYDFFGGFRDLQPRHRAGAAQPQLRRGPDAPAARDPLRGSARLPHGRAHAVAGARVHRHAAGRRPLLGAPARRAARPPGRAAGGPRRSGAWRSSASTARCTRTSMPARDAVQLVESRRARDGGGAVLARRARRSCGSPACARRCRRRGLRVARAPAAPARATRTWWPPR